MSVTEQVMSEGSWNVRLSNLPDQLFTQIDHFDHVVFIPNRIDVREYDDTTILTLARYTGIIIDVRKSNDGTVTLSGPSIVAHLGDHSERGPIPKNRISFQAETFNNVIAGLLPDAITPGTIHTVPGGYTGQHDLQTPKESITYVCELYGAEWRVNPDGTLDAGLQTDLYETTSGAADGDTPRALIVREGSAGWNPNIETVASSKVEAAISAEEYVNRVLLLGAGPYENVVQGDQTAGTIPYKDLHGNPLDRRIVVNEPDTILDNADARAQVHLNEHNQPTQSVSLDSINYHIEGPLQIGDYVSVFDPPFLYDTNNETTFQGEPIWPTNIRILSLTWPITENVGVYVRSKNGTYIDLTPYIQVEKGSTRIEVGDVQRDILGNNSLLNTVRGRVVTGSEGFTVPDVPTKNTPFTTDTYFGADGQVHSTIVVDWNEPLNTDASTIYDGANYQIRWKVQGDTYYYYNVTDWDTTNITLYGLDPGVTYQIGVEAVDKTGNHSGYGTDTTVTAAVDTTAPSQPSTPTVTGEVLSIKVSQNVTKQSDGSPLENDIATFRIYASTTSGFTPSTSNLVGEVPVGIDNINSAYPTVYTFGVPDTTTWYVKTSFVDHSGNESATSNETSAAATLVDTTQLNDGSVTDTKIGSGAINSITKFASGITPVQVVDTLPGTATEGDQAYLTVDKKLYRYDGSAWIAVVATTDLTGTISETQIADGAVSVAKFAAGINPVQVVSSLPGSASEGDIAYLTTDNKLYRYDGSAWIATVDTVDLVGTITADGIASGSALPGTGTVGDLFYLTTDNKLYRYDGSNWIATVDTSDLTGTISEGQIADGAVSIAKFASGIQPVQVVSSLPGTASEGDVAYLTTDNKLYRYDGSAWIAAVDTSDLTGTISTTQITDGAISTPKLAANAVTTAKLAAGAVTANEIAANTITGGEIAAGAISTDELAANAVTVEKLMVGSFDNLVTNPGFEADTVGGSGDPHFYTGSSVATWSTETTLVRSGDRALRIDFTATNNAYTRAYFNGVSTSTVKHQAATEGDTFYVEAWARTVTGSVPEVSPGVLIQVYDASGTFIANGTAKFPTLTTSWQKQSHTYTCPAGTAYVVFAVGWGINDAVTAGKVAIFDDIYARRMVEGDIIVDGTVTAAKIAADTITANEIASGTITSTEIATDTITASQIAAGTITAAEIASGTITANEIASGTITANEIASNTITSANIAANTITSAEIAANTITAGEIAAGAISTDELAADAVTAAKIASNTITASEIASGTITASKIAANTITSNEIAANTITAGEIAAGAVSTDELAASAVTAAKIAANTITASEIASGTITASEIATGTITADEIASGTITAGKLVVGGGPNLIGDPSFEAVTNVTAGTGYAWFNTGDGRVDAWQYTNTEGATIEYGDTNALSKHTGNGVVRFAKNAPATAGSGTGLHWTGGSGEAGIRVAEGDVLRVSVWVNNYNTTTGAIYIGVHWLNESGTGVGQTYIPGSGVAGFNGQPTNTWAQWAGAVTAPAGAVYARMRILLFQLSGTVYIDDVSFSTGADTSYISSLSADKITTGTLNANNVTVTGTLDATSLVVNGSRITAGTVGSSYIATTLTGKTMRAYQGVTAYSWASDTDSGMRQDSAGQIYFYVNGVAQYYINTTRNLLSNDLFNNSNNFYDIGESAKAFANVYAYSYPSVSDASEKTDISRTNLGLNFLKRLTPAQYRWRDTEDRQAIKAINAQIEQLREQQQAALDADGNETPESKTISEQIRRLAESKTSLRKPGTRLHHGLVAQDVVRALKAEGVSTADFAGVIIDDQGKHLLRYNEFIGPIIAAIQELADRVEALENA